MLPAVWESWALPLARLALLAAALADTTHAAGLVDTIKTVKPAVVGIGTYMKTRSPTVVFVATGFAVADGLHVVTNAHAVNKPLDTEHLESRIVLVSQNGEPRGRAAELLSLDEEHDLALLRISGEPLPPLKLGDSATVSEGQPIAFTGFPIGLVLGFHPSTHTGLVSAITPVALPGVTAQQLNARMVRRIRNSAYQVFQLDATAYPGNSGSPLYNPADGAVYGIINSVFVQSTRENAIISHPSGITYAIPSVHIRNLLQSQKILNAD
jgi:serine protease Do